MKTRRQSAITRRICAIQAITGIAVILGITLWGECLIPNAGAQDQQKAGQQSPPVYPNLQIADVLQTAQLAVTLSQTAVTSIQTIATLLSFFVGAITIVSFIVVLLYRQKLEKTEEIVRGLVQRMEDLRNTAIDLKSFFAQIEAKEKEIESSLRVFLSTKDNLTRDYKQIAKVAEALHAAFELKDPNLSIRLGHLQRLSQLVHPVGIVPMVEILKNSSEDESLRAEAAYGLGCFSENKDLQVYWSQILSCLRDVLQEGTIPERVVIDAVTSAAKFGSEARGLFGLIIDWSRNEKPQIRRACAEAFGLIGVYDHAVAQRLEEIIAADKADEVRQAGNISLRALREFRKAHPESLM